MKKIATCAQLACVLEASAPKPGNVNRYHDFRDTKYEHFLASGIAIGRFAEGAASRGFEAGKGNISISNIGVGRLIRDAVFETKRWHSGRNTNLGTAMLLIPLSAACGVMISKLKKIENKNIRKNLDSIIKKSTYKDSLFLYEAIRAAKPGGLGKLRKLDVNDKCSDREIIKKKLNLYDIFKFSKDSIAEELTTKMRISFEIGYPKIRESYSKKKDINAAILYSFLEILSRVPDSLIARKNSMKVAQEISQEARAVLETGMDAGRLSEFDRKLRDKNNRLNPGTTADLVTSSLMIALLNGLKI
ncbi:MAG: triphosphoribosyl-dephospho-CoA synthase [Methanobacteriota archaeon]